MSRSAAHRRRHCTHFARRRPQPLIVSLRTPLSRAQAPGKHTGSDFDALAIGLRRATPALDVLAEQPLARWLYLAAGVARLASPHIAAA